MSLLPVITGFGGISPAGRSSGFQAFRRILLDGLSVDKKQDTLLSLAALMGLVTAKDGAWVSGSGEILSAPEVALKFGSMVTQGTLLRRIEKSHFDPGRIPYNKLMKLNAPGGLRFELDKKDLPNEIPSNWRVEPGLGNQVRVEVEGALSMLQPDRRKSLAQTGGQLPTGFDPGELYASKHHPRGLMMALYGASDALGQSGIALDEIKALVRPDQIGVFSGSAMGQLDDLGLGGYMKSALQGKRTSTKQMPFSLAEMPADFINAYIMGSVGQTGGILGACASTLYNLDLAAKEITSGRLRVALVGMSEAPLVPEVFEGYRVMSALAEDEQLALLDHSPNPDYRRACRPFGLNCGFTLAESSQYFLVMDDELALELGAVVYGAIGGIFVNADGIKKSISAPGVGNYLSIAKAAALTRAICGEAGLRNRSFVHAHGTGTPQNRVTESHGLNEVAKNFGIGAWPVAAIKCYLGHSIGTAAGDQLMAALGTWAEGMIPGIFTLDQLAPDVHHSNLSFSQAHRQVNPKEVDAALLNSKGFGGNNATGVILSPHLTRRMIAQKQGAKVYFAYLDRAVKRAEQAAQHDLNHREGKFRSIYRFGEEPIEGTDLTMQPHQIEVPGFAQPLNLDLENPFKDMTP